MREYDSVDNWHVVSGGCEKKERDEMVVGIAVGGGAAAGVVEVGDVGAESVDGVVGVAVVVDDVGVVDVVVCDVAVCGGVVE